MNRSDPLHRRLRHGDGDAGGAAEAAAATTCSGSDQDVYPPMSDFLAAERHPASRRLRAPSTSRPTVDLVVVGNAISRGNPELEAVLDRKIRYCSLPEAIREHFLWGARSIVIAGTHGKTTTTSLTGWLLTHGGRRSRRSSSAASPRNFGDTGSSYRVGQGRDFVIEGDEYDSAFFDKTAKFLKYLPDIAVINNIEFDHADIYADLDAVRLAFRRLVNLVPRSGLLLLGADSPDARGAEADGACRRWRRSASDESADWRATISTRRRRLDARSTLRHGRARLRRVRAAAPRRAQRPQRARRDRCRQRASA